MHRKPTIKVLSASDRFNYGDLLFPIITIKELSKYGDFKFTNIAIKKSNLSKIGALPTRSYASLFKGTPKSDFVIVAGGDVLSVNWSSIYSYLNIVYNKIYWRVKNKQKLEVITKKLFGRENISNPFVPTSNLICPSNLIFHGVGGSSTTSPTALNKIEKSAYFSVREKGSQNNLQRHFAQPVKLVPDPAILMSDYFQTPSIKKGYIAFQIGHYSTEIQLITAQLRAIHESYAKKIVLLPIGNCIGHNDIISLRQIKAMANFPCDLIEKPDISRIMMTIAGADFFFGTSLHGVITAMSFAVPYAGMNPKIIKMKNYLETWGAPFFNETVTFEMIFHTYSTRKKIDDSILIENSQNQKTIARESFKKIASIITRNTP